MKHTISTEKLLSPRQKRALKALQKSPTGILSFKLRDNVGVMNISDLVCQLRDQGYHIECKLEAHTDQDGETIHIGRYFLRA